MGTYPFLSALEALLQRKSTEELKLVWKEHEKQGREKRGGHDSDSDSQEVGKSSWCSGFVAAVIPAKNSKIATAAKSAAQKHNNDCWFVA